MIECVHVLGWQCVANKGEFQVGDKCVYMEVDSFLSVCDEFEFLRDTSFKQDEVLGAGFRLKTRKFRFPRAWCSRCPFCRRESIRSVTM